jgi:hypothetical protein
MTNQRSGRNWPHRRARASYYSTSGLTAQLRKLQTFNWKTAQPQPGGIRVTPCFQTLGGNAMVSDPRHPIVGDLSGSRAAGIIFELGNRQSADPMDVRARSPGPPGRSVELTCTAAVLRYSNTFRCAIATDRTESPWGLPCKRATPASDGEHQTQHGARNGRHRRERFSSVPGHECILFAAK